MFKAIVQRDVCGFCGRSFGRCDADHIDPLSGHGDNVWSNLAGVCARCNRSKGNKPLLIFLLDGLSDAKSP